MPAVIAGCGGTGLPLACLTIGMMIVRRVGMGPRPRAVIVAAGFTRGRMRIAAAVIVMPAASADGVPQHCEAGQDRQELRKHGGSGCVEKTPKVIRLTTISENRLTLVKINPQFVNLSAGWRAEYTNSPENNAC